jgi:hypothetical protein
MGLGLLFALFWLGFFINGGGKPSFKGQVFVRH